MARATEVLEQVRSEQSKKASELEDRCKAEVTRDHEANLS